MQCSVVQCIALQRNTRKRISIQFKELHCTTLESTSLQYAHRSTSKCSWLLSFVTWKYFNNIDRFKKFYQVQYTAVQSKGSSAVQYIAVPCKSEICNTVKFNAVQWIELLWIETIYISKTFYWNALHRKEVQCNSMRKKFRLVLCCRVHSSPPPLIQIPKRRRKTLWFFFLYRCFYISISQEIWCLPYAGFLFKRFFEFQIKWH